MTTKPNRSAPENGPFTGEFAQNMAKLVEIMGEVQQAAALHFSLSDPNHAPLVQAFVQSFADFSALFSHVQQNPSQSRQPKATPPEDPSQASDGGSDRASQSHAREMEPLLEAMSQSLNRLSAQVRTVLERDGSALQGRGASMAQACNDALAALGWADPKGDPGAGPWGRAVQTQGRSLVQGAHYLLYDLQADPRYPLLTLADQSAFELGVNMAATDGKVVYRNGLIELIAYEPRSERVFEQPIVLFPPWVNKYYILDLTPQSSLVRWLLEQGYAVFIVSWINPDRSLGELGLADYLEQGYLEAIDFVATHSPSGTLHAAGYCLGGTALALAAAVLRQKGSNALQSVSFFATLTDFSQPGVFEPFLTPSAMEAMAERYHQTGLVEAGRIAAAFRELRPKDLIFEPALRRYLLGEAPPKSAMLSWNADGTDLPGAMALEFYRSFVQGNQFAEGGLDILGHHVSPKEIDLPVFAVGCETDHIAPWQHCYAGLADMASQDKVFVRAGSGHVAGIVNPPDAGKYGFMAGPYDQGSSQDWEQGARRSAGSWWSYWAAWLAERSGPQHPARPVKDQGLSLLGAAPGTYVRKSG